MKAADPTKEVVFDLSDDRVLRITPQAVKQLAGFRQSKFPDEEAGGVLLGRLMEPTGEILVDSITFPHARDKRTLFSFWRARDPHQKRVDEEWKASSGVCNYLGEWHSHPEDAPEPSGHDETNWRRIVREAKYEQDVLIFVIIGRRRIGAWSLGRKQRSPKRLIQRMA